MASEGAIEDAIQMLQALPDEGSFSLTLYTDETSYNATLGVGDHGERNVRVQVGLIAAHAIAFQDAVDGPPLSTVFDDAGAMAAEISQQPRLIDLRNEGGP